MNQEIKVEATVHASIQKVWEYWTTPEHINHWNTASPDWHNTHATNDLTIGGKFSYHMAAKDGSFEFDFEGIYTQIIPNQLIAYSLGDGRKVSIQFEEVNNQTHIIEIFDAEQVNSIELQQGGWQAILNNFKKYTETN